MNFVTNLRDVAQLVARCVRDAEVAGSNPVIPTKHAGSRAYWNPLLLKITV